MKTVEESGVIFGEFEEEQLFVIEYSDVHKKAGEGIKTVEFVYLTKNDNLLFVEAKKSCPNAANRYEDANKEIKYEEYYSEITDKFIDSINMYAATALGRYNDCTSVGKKLRNKDSYEKTKLRFILVITNAEDDWLMGPKAELEERLLRYRKIWKADILVLNRQTAKDFGLVKED